MVQGCAASFVGHPQRRGPRREREEVGRKGRVAALGREVDRGAAMLVAGPDAGAGSRLMTLLTVGLEGRGRSLAGPGEVVEDSAVELIAGGEIDVGAAAAQNLP